MEESPAFSRQLLIGLDAAEWQLVSRWAQEGKLPVFRRLIEQGTRAVLSSTAGQLPDTVWAAIYTGANPAKFEKYYYVQYDAATLGLRHVMDDAIRLTPFWEHLSEAGRRVGVVDAPKFRVSSSLCGFQVANWGAHATKTARASLPLPLLEQINTRFGAHPVGDCDAMGDRPASLQELRRRAIEGVRLRGKVNRWLMQEQEWDVFFAAFSESHCIGHHFWHWLDPTHPRYKEADTHGLTDAIEQVYRALDDEIGQMLDLVDSDTLCMVFTGHGMGPMHQASWNLPEMLELLGYGRKPASMVKAEAPREARINPWRILKMVVPGRLQYAIKGMLPRSLQDKLIFLWYSGGQNWEGSRAFSVPNNDSIGAIRIGVRGRDKNGLVEPGEEYNQVCRSIADALRELTDPVSGRPVVAEVTLTHEMFHGPHLDLLPDITVQWDQSFAWSSLHSPRFGTLHLRDQDGRTGSHTPYGFLLATGPGIAPGVELTGHSIYDIAPTILQASGAPIPPDCDGKPLPLRPMMVAE